MLHLLPFLAGIPGAIFLQDNARPQTAGVAQDCLRHVQTLPYPNCSPDISPWSNCSPDMYPWPNCSPGMSPWPNCSPDMHPLPNCSPDMSPWPNCSPDMYPWPNCSLDMSPIEHLKRQLPPCHNIWDSEHTILQLWTRLPQDNIRRMLDFMPDRVAACIAKQGKGGGIYEPVDRNAGSCGPRSELRAHSDPLHPSATRARRSPGRPAPAARSAETLVGALQSGACVGRAFLALELHSPIHLSRRNYFNARPLCWYTLHARPVECSQDVALIGNAFSEHPTIAIYCSRGRSSVVVRLLASHLGELGSTPGWVAPGCGNRARRCRWSASFLGDLPFPPPMYSGAAPYSHRSISSRHGRIHHCPCIGHNRGRLAHSTLTASSWERLIRPGGDRCAAVEYCRNERARETGDLRENPLTSGIIRHDSHIRERPRQESKSVRKAAKKQLTRDKRRSGSPAQRSFALHCTPAVTSQSRGPIKFQNSTGTCTAPQTIGSLHPANQIANLNPRNRSSWKMENPLAGFFFEVLFQRLKKKERSSGCRAGVV
ncbi:hypothetical protein PR048_003203 [Dryococelus australis]|uniref:Uncharacterized protein n=1 Tax=Dryococelus australis TaxID=614101 RepID=A0ABQ9INV5_9NEOP|nr:hypothetical protein PR048_003203 [Dryococelus australis]